MLSRVPHRGNDNMPSRKYQRPRTDAAASLLLHRWVERQVPHQAFGIPQKQNILEPLLLLLFVVGLRLSFSRFINIKDCMRFRLACWSGVYNNATTGAQHQLSSVLLTRKCGCMSHRYTKCRQPLGSESTQGASGYTTLWKGWTFTLNAHRTVSGAPTLPFTQNHFWREWES